MIKTLFVKFKLLAYSISIYLMRVEVFHKHFDKRGGGVVVEREREEVMMMRFIAYVEKKSHML